MNGVPWVEFLLFETQKHFVIFMGKNRAHEIRCAIPNLYRVTQKNLQNLLLTWFRQFRQLVGRYCS